MNPLDAYFINQSHNPCKLTFVNPSFWEKRAAIHKLRRPLTYPPHTILREVSRVSSLILRAKPWLANKVWRPWNRFAARVRRRFFRRERSDDRKWVCCSQALLKVAEHSFGSLLVYIICQIVARERLQPGSWNLAGEKYTDERFWLTGKTWRFRSFHGNMNDWIQP